MCCSKYWFALGAIFGGLGVALGALGAHGVDEYLVDVWGAQTKQIAGFEVPAAWKYLQDFRTAASYQTTHALALLAVALLSMHQARRGLMVAGICFSVGILLFCGSLYAIALTGAVKLGMIAPIGGSLLIAGWLSLATVGFQLIRESNACRSSGGVAQVPLPMSDNRRETDPLRV